MIHDIIMYHFASMFYESHSQSCIETLHERRSGNEV